MTSVQTTKVMYCGCAHDYQDEKYGKNMRVHNYGEKCSPTKGPGWRCTVCGRTKSKGGD